MNIFLAILLAICANHINAQKNSFFSVDSITYNMFINEQWEELVEYSNTLNKSEFNYYNLNLRIGIAYFRLGKYIQSEHYFLRALKNNSLSELAKEYLFVLYDIQGDDFRASKYFLSLSEKTQGYYQYTIAKPIDFVYAEGGVKISDSRNIMDNIQYASLSLSQKPQSNYRLVQNVNFLNQKTVSTDFQQYQFALLQQLSLKKDYVISLGLHYSQYKTQFLSQKTYRYEVVEWYDIYKYVSDIQERYYWDGRFTQHFGLTYLGIQKRIQRLSLGLGVNSMFEQGIPSYSETRHTEIETTVWQDETDIDVYKTEIYDTIFHKNVNTLHFQPEINLDFRINNQVKIGLDILMYNSTKQTSFIINPRLEIQLLKSLSLSCSYFQNVKHPVSFHRGMLVYTGYNHIKHTLSLISTIRLKEHLQLFLVYKNESVKDNIILSSYKFNTMILGCMYRL
jgi:tetratricopeptide (TPR) repeat protein